MPNQPLISETTMSIRIRKRILVVDDDPDSLAILQVGLAQEGFDASAASDGFEALWRVRERLPDLIVTDQSMPGMTGIELCSRLRAATKTHDIPMILYTGHTSDVPGGCFDRVIHKPASLSDITKEIWALLRSGPITEARTPPELRPHSPGPSRRL